MEWAKSYSRTYCGAIGNDEQRARALAAIWGFVSWRERVLAKLRVNGIPIPLRAKKGESLLESLAVSVPSELKGEIVSLLRARERIIPMIMPTLKRAAMEFLARKLNKPSYELKEELTCTQFEVALARAARQGLDRTSPDKIGIRVDFVLAAVSRIIPQIQQEQQFLRIALGEEADHGEIAQLSQEVC